MNPISGDVGNVPEFKQVKIPTEKGFETTENVSVFKGNNSPSVGMASPEDLLNKLSQSKSEADLPKMPQTNPSIVSVLPNFINPKRD